MQKGIEIPKSSARWQEQPQIQEQHPQENYEKMIAITTQHRLFLEFGGSPFLICHSVPSSEKPAATSLSCALVIRDHIANCAINRTTSEQTLPLRSKALFLPQRRTSRLMRPEDKEGKANKHRNRRQEEGREDNNGGILADTSIPASEEASEQNLANCDAPEPHKTRLGKRKKSQEDLQSIKVPRLDRADILTQEAFKPPTGNLSAMRKCERAPSFSRPNWRRKIREQFSPPRPGLGLGITKSPRRKQPKSGPGHGSGSGGEEEQRLGLTKTKYC